MLRTLPLAHSWAERSDYSAEYQLFTPVTPWLTGSWGSLLPSIVRECSTADGAVAQKRSDSEIGTRLLLHESRFCTIVKSNTHKVNHGSRDSVMLQESLVVLPQHISLPFRMT